MVESPTLESLREALAPVEALRGEQSQLERSLLESFAALDGLHGELSEWQRELTRQQAALDQRAAALDDSGVTKAGDDDFQGQLAASREEARQLEAENAEQFQTIEQLDRQLAVANAELRVTKKHADELSSALQNERERAAEDHRHWTSELRELRRLMERQGALLERLTGEQPSYMDDTSLAAGEGAEGELAESADDAVAKAAELRRRASSRRAVQRRPN